MGNAETLAKLKARLAWGLKGNLLPHSLAELRRQIAELEREEESK